MKIIALLDCNNFFASCERLFQPELRNRPLVVLSNNDGCVIARSNEAKTLGIKMGEPVFKCEYLIKRHRVQTRSVNFALYSDISNRVMSEIYRLIGEVEVYSVDEAFMILGDSDNLDPQAAIHKAKSIHAHIERAIGIPISIGIATTKTLAKLANRIAKDNEQGVFSLYFNPHDPELANAQLDAALYGIDIGEVWGIGWNYQKFLKAHGLHKVLDLKYANSAWIKQTMKVHGSRTQMELRGLSCIPFNDSDTESKAAKSIITSRSFSHKITSIGPLKEAVANFTATAAQKLRRQKLTTKTICVYAQKSQSKSDSAISELKISSSYTPDLISVSEKLIEQIYQPGFSYKKAGVVFYNLVPANQVQLSLIAESDLELKEQCTNLVDKINQSLGSNTLFWASMGIERSWKGKSTNRSPAYTSDWNELPLVF